MAKSKIIQTIKRPRSFFSADVEKITKVKRNRLYAWVAQGWITPSIKESEGTGSHNEYSEIDLVIISIFKKLVESGLSRKTVATFVPALRGLKDDLRRVRIPSELNYEPLWILFFRKDGTPTEYISFLSDDVKDAFTSPNALDADDIIGLNIAKVFVEISKGISNR